MKSFREIVEALTYKASEEDISNFKNIDDYNKEIKGSITSYIKDKKVIFNYDSKTKKITIIKQGWQLMNLERGF